MEIFAIDEILQTNTTTQYFINGDFQPDGGDGRNLIFYESIPVDNPTAVSCFATSEGDNLQWRIIGESEGLIFDTGYVEYGQSVSVSYADRYDLILRKLDSEGDVIPFDVVTSCRVVWSYPDNIPIPTTPPELIATDTLTVAPFTTVPTVTMPVLPDIDVDKVIEPVTVFLSYFTFVFSGLSNLYGTEVLVFCGLLLVTSFFLYGRGDDE